MIQRWRVESTESEEHTLDTEAENVPKKAAKANHWNQALLSSMTDPELVVNTNTYIVTIKDKYPKAKHHYLVLPKKQVANLQSMTKEDLDLLRMMDKEAARLAASHPDSQFQAGYHAVPSVVFNYSHQDTGIYGSIKKNI